MGNEASAQAAAGRPLPPPLSLALPGNSTQPVRELPDVESISDADVDADGDLAPVKRDRDPAAPVTSRNGSALSDAQPIGGGNVGSGALEWLKEGARYASGIPLPSTRLLGRLVGAHENGAVPDERGAGALGDHRSPHQSDKSSSSRSWSWSRPSSEGGEAEQSPDSSPVTPVEPDLSVFTDEVRPLLLIRMPHPIHPHRHTHRHTQTHSPLTCLLQCSIHENHVLRLSNSCSVQWSSVELVQ